MWERTDELQFVKKINDDEFEVIETINVAGEFYVVDELWIDLNDYNLEEEIKGYYDSLEELKAFYSNNWRKIVAEIIAENNASLSDGTKFDSVSDVCSHLWYEYQIDIHTM